MSLLSDKHKGIALGVHTIMTIPAIGISSTDECAIKYSWKSVKC